jgi:hypothetical protein
MASEAASEILSAHGIFRTPIVDMSRVSVPDGTVLDFGQGYLDHIQAIQYCNAEIRVSISGGPAER